MPMPLMLYILFWAVGFENGASGSSDRGSPTTLGYSQCLWDDLAEATNKALAHHEAIGSRIGPRGAPEHSDAMGLMIEIVRAARRCRWRW
jgi:hypothetical protein